MNEVCIEGEEWRVVPGFKGQYEASSEGRVRRVSGKACRQGNWRILKTFVDKRIGYVRIAVMRNGKVYKTGLHNLIASAFLGPCPDGLECDHVDRDKTNNKPSNLEYVTHAENLRRAREIKNWSRKGTHSLKLTPDQAAEIRTSALSLRVLAKRYSVSSCTIHNIKHGKYYAEAL